MFKQYLLGSTVLRAPEAEGDGATPEEERIEVTDEDDEGTTDPAGEPEEGDDAGAEDDGSDELDDAARERQRREAGQRERQPSRAERRIQALDSRLKQLADDNARITRELSEARQRAPAPQQEDPRVEQERLALMSPEERADYRINQALRRNEYQNQMLATKLMDQSDRVAFEAKAAGDKLRTRLLPEVERQRADLRSKGLPVPDREVMFTYLVGQRALQNRTAARPQAQARVQRQQARPANGRSDAEPVRARRGQTAEDRLKDIVF